MKTDRLLIVNVNWVGDVLLSTPAIRALRKQFPTSFIACLVPKRCKSVLSNNPYLNEVLVFDDRRSFFSWIEFYRLVFILKKRRFDTALFFHRSKTRIFLTLLAGIKNRLGFGDGGARRQFLTQSFPFPARSLHRTDYFLKLLEALGVPADGRSPDFFCSDDDKMKRDILFKEHSLKLSDSYVALHAGGNWGLKRWPDIYFVRWIKLFLKEFPSFKVILCGTAGEESLCRGIQRYFDQNEVVSLCGKTPFGVLALILKKARLVVSNDSGPIHLAAAQGGKVIGLFGPTHPEYTGPIMAPGGSSTLLRNDVGCQVPCYFEACDYRICMESLKPEEVFKKSVEILRL